MGSAPVMLSRRAALAAIALTLGACSTRPDPAEKLTVAAAANLTGVFDDVGRAFRENSGLDVVFSYGSTAELAQQIDNGAPFDLFAAADAEHVDALIRTGKLNRDSRAIYALGQLALWVPQGEKNDVRKLQDLAAKPIRFIAVAQPSLAPYGQATVDALEDSGLWQTLEKKMVYANSISLAKQLAATGNADAAFTAYSLVLHEQGAVLKVDPRLYHPIEQALAIVASSARMPEAKQFRDFLLGKAGQDILHRSGYLSPSGRQ